MSRDHEVFMGRIMELPLLRSTPLDQNYSNVELKDPLTQSQDIQFITMVQEIEEVSVIHKSTTTHTITGTHTEHLRSSTHNGNNQVQQQDNDAFIRQLNSLRSDSVEQKHFTYTLNQQLSGTIEIQIVEQIEEISLIHNSTTISGFSAHGETAETHTRSYDGVQRHQPQRRKPYELLKQSGSSTWSWNHSNSTARDSSDQLRTYDTYAASSYYGQQNQLQPRPSHSHSKQSGSSIALPRNRGTSTAISDSSTRAARPICNEKNGTLRKNDSQIFSSDDVQRHQPLSSKSHSKESQNIGNSSAFRDSSTHPLRPEAKDKTDTLRTHDIHVISSDDEEQYQPLPKQSGRSTRKKQAIKCSPSNEHARSQFRTDETHDISTDDQLPSLPRRQKQIISVSRCRCSDRNKRDHGKECARQVKSRNASHKSLLNIRKGKKSFECNTCNKTFNQKSHLNNHLRIHSGEKPYQCNICNQSFNQRTILKNHLRIHTGEKPFKCKICSRAFNQSTILTNHLRTHTGEKPYQCRTCNRAFKQKSNLTMHLKTDCGI